MKIGKTGVIKDNPIEIRERLYEEVKKKIKGFVDLPSSLQNNLIDESVVLECEMQDMISNMMNSISPTYANDFIVKELGEAFGLKMKDKQLPITTITFKGKIGVLIPEGVEVGNADGSKTFKTTESKIINASGEADVAALGVDYYDTPTPANSLNVMINKIANVDSCTNKNDVTESVPAETIEQFRNRFLTRTKANRAGTIATLDNNIKAVNGVSDRLVTYVETHVRDEEQVKSVLEVIVGGGDDYEVAAALFSSVLYPDLFVSNPSGDEDARTVNLMVTFNDVEFPITYTRPKINPISFNIALSVQSGFINIPSEAFTELLRPYFEKYVNNLKIGYTPTGYSFDDLIYQCFKDNFYNKDIITGITYTLNVNGSLASLNGQRQLLTEKDVAYTLKDFKVVLTGGKV